MRANINNHLSARRLKMSMLVLAVVLASCSVAAAPGGISKEEAKAHLERAERAFRKGLDMDASRPEEAPEYFREAIARYRKLADEGFRNGKIYYDIGNAYFRLDDIGRAVLNYKRAALYTPNDANLKQNLEYARSRRKNVVEEKEREKVLKTLFFFHYDLPYSVRFLIFTLSFALIWLSASLYIFFKRGAVRTAIVIFALVSLLFLVSILAETFNLNRYPEGVIVDEAVIARKGDAETYQPSFTEPLSSGTEFRLVERRGEWWQIELADGTRSWIEADSAETVIE